MHIIVIEGYITYIVKYIFNLITSVIMFYIFDHSTTEFKDYISTRNWMTEGAVTELGNDTFGVTFKFQLHVVY